MQRAGPEGPASATIAPDQERREEMETMATELETKAPAREDHQFIGGEWVDAQTAARSRTATRSPASRWRGRRGNAGRRAARDRSAADAAAAWAAAPPAVRQGIFLKAADVAREPPGRGRLAARARDRLHVRLRHVPDALRARALAPGGGAGVRAARRGDPVGHRARSRWACGARSASSARSRRGTRR